MSIKAKITPANFWALPVTSCRVIAALQYIFREVQYVQLSTSDFKLEVLNNAYSSLPPTVESSSHVENLQTKLSKNSVQQILASFTRAKVCNLRPWVISSTYTIIYFLWKHRRVQEVRPIYKLVMDKAGYRSTDQETTVKTVWQKPYVQLLVNKYILKKFVAYGTKGGREDGSQGITQKKTDALKSLMNRSKCRLQTRAILNNISYFGFENITEEDEKDMAFFLKLIECKDCRVHGNVTYERRIIYPANRTISPHCECSGRVTEEQPMPGASLIERRDDYVPKDADVRVLNNKNEAQSCIQVLHNDSTDRLYIPIANDEAQLQVGALQEDEDEEEEVEEEAAEEAEKEKEEEEVEEERKRVEPSVSNLARKRGRSIKKRKVIEDEFNIGSLLIAKWTGYPGWPVQYMGYDYLRKKLKIKVFEGDGSLPYNSRINRKWIEPFNKIVIETM